MFRAAVIVCGGAAVYYGFAAVGSGVARVDYDLMVVGNGFVVVVCGHAVVYCRAAKREGRGGLPNGVVAHFAKVGRVHRQHNAVVWDACGGQSVRNALFHIVRYNPDFAVAYLKIDHERSVIAAVFKVYIEEGVPIPLRVHNGDNLPVRRDARQFFPFREQGVNRFLRRFGLHVGSNLHHAAKSSFSIFDCDSGGAVKSSVSAGDCFYVGRNPPDCGIIALIYGKRRVRMVMIHVRAKVGATGLLEIAVPDAFRNTEVEAALVLQTPAAQDAEPGDASLRQLAAHSLQYAAELYDDEDDLLPMPADGGRNNA